MAKVAEKSVEYRAEARYQRSSPQKVKLVLDLIKGKKVEQALNTVHFTQKHAAPIVEKVLASAVANARHIADERGLDLDVDNLYVKTAVANEGPRLKRLRPAPMGRAFRYQRRTAHIVVTVAERPSSRNLVTKVEEPVAEAPAAKSAAKKTTAKKPAAKKPAAKKSSK
jgi:large subunit ribosomal protein L22